MICRMTLYIHPTWLYFGLWVYNMTLSVAVYSKFEISKHKYLTMIVYITTALEQKDNEIDFILSCIYYGYCSL